MPQFGVSLYEPTTSGTGPANEVVASVPIWISSAVSGNGTGTDAIGVQLTESALVSNTTIPLPSPIRQYRSAVGLYARHTAASLRTCAQMLPVSQSISIASVTLSEIARRNVVQPGLDVAIAGMYATA